MNPKTLTPTQPVVIFDSYIEFMSEGLNPVKVGNVTFVWENGVRFHDIPSEKWDIKAMTNDIKKYFERK